MGYEKVWHSKLHPYGNQMFSSIPHTNPWAAVMIVMMISIIFIIPVGEYSLYHIFYKLIESNQWYVLPSSQLKGVFKLMLILFPPCDVTHIFGFIDLCHTFFISAHWTVYAIEFATIGEPPLTWDGVVVWTVRFPCIFETLPMMENHEGSFQQHLSDPCAIYEKLRMIEW